MICAAMIVGPGEAGRYLDRTLRLAARWADLIVTHSDGADPDTLDALWYHRTCRSYDTVSRFTNHESDVRNRLLARLDEVLEPGALVVVLDADEDLQALDGRPARNALRTLEDSDEPGPWPARFHHLWRADGTAYRTDKAWAPSDSWRLYRHRKGARVPDRALACKAIPVMPDAHIDPVLRVLHWGYARHEDRSAKHTRYMNIDGGRFHSRPHLESILDTTILTEDL